MTNTAAYVSWSNHVGKTHNIPLTLATNKTNIDLNILAKSLKVVDFFKNMTEKKHFNPISFEVTDADWFCKPGLETPGNLGFWKGKLEAVNLQTGKLVASNICNNRGGCVACLFIVHCVINGKQKTLIPVTVQDRLPSGGECEELMAGMKDEETGRLKLGKLAKEVQEEMPICKIAEDDTNLIHLGTIFTSPGWSDEYIELWCKEIDVPLETYNYLLSNTFGEGDHEVIKVRFYEYDQDFNDHVVPTLTDCKLLSALYKYEALKRKQGAKNKRSFDIEGIVYPCALFVAVWAFILSFVKAFIVIIALDKQRI